MLSGVIDSICFLESSFPKHGFLFHSGARLTVRLGEEKSGPLTAGKVFPKRVTVGTFFALARWFNDPSEPVN